MVKLGLIDAPMTQGAMSKLVFKEMGTIPPQNSEQTFELRTLGNATIGSGGIRMQTVPEDECSSDRDLEMAIRASAGGAIKHSDFLIPIVIICP
jgi:hypothetical protein